MNRRHLLALAACTAVLLQGCATAPGAPFASLDPVPAGKGHLYVYRKAALYAVGAKYKVKAANGMVLGELYNASYLLLPVAPGKHQFSVEEASFLKPKTFEVDVKPGQNYFVEYDSSKGLLLGLGLLSDSNARSEAQALADLKGLNRAN
jgi:Protein of unknown function (DUF2846)